jgi:hypothetical protein
VGFFGAEANGKGVVDEEVKAAAEKTAGELVAPAVGWPKLGKDATRRWPRVWRGCRRELLRNGGRRRWNFGRRRLGRRSLGGGAREEEERRRGAA